MNIKNKIQEYLASTGENITDLAKKADVSQPTISRILKKEGHSPGQATMNKLEKAMKSDQENGPEEDLGKELSKKMINELLEELRDKRQRIKDLEAELRAFREGREQKKANAEGGF